mmetsp:Transcript_12991/g.24781  ORF Transcript_12991/g.24781 Transcript_12991/m.24781 type:complete len:311 (+) Transcript_12991:181-1113(+)
MTTAEEMKEEGNTLYKSKEWLKAAAVYTKGIKMDPEHAVLYSNRSAAFLQLLKVQKALADAETCIKLRPTWEKGYFRKGCALEALEKFEQALACFREAAEHNPKNTEVARKIANIARYVNNLKRRSASEQAAPVTTAEDYAEAKKDWKLGVSVAYDVKRVESWAKAQLSEATNNWIAGDMAAYVQFLPGKKDQDGDSIVGQVAVKEAFDSPDTLENCCQFLRQYAQDMSSHAACIVAPKSAIAFPQVWKKSAWKGGNADGFFVQIDSPDFRRVWFIPCGQDKGRAVPREPVSLDEDTFRLLPPLTQKTQE